MSEETNEGTKVEETKVDETKVDEIKVEDKKEIPALDAEQQAAIKLFNALKDPETSGAALRYLAETAGLELTKKQDRTELKKSISDIVKEGLGEDNSYLAEKLGPTLERIIDEAIQSRLKPLQETLATKEQEIIAEEINTVFSDLEKATKGLSKQLEARMIAIMDTMAPGPKTKPSTYIKQVYRLAKADFDEAERLKAQDKMRDENKTHANVSGGVNLERVKAGSKLPSIREAVLAATQGKLLE